ncbi:hypothetical protein ES708_17160 [subsurface metagenome]
MKMLTEKKMEEFIEKHIDEKALAQYFTAPWGDSFGLYPDGSHAVGQSIGMEIDPEERPYVVVKVPGTGNIDTNFWLGGWTHRGENTEIIVDETSEEIDLEEAIRRCCQDGDVSGELEDLKEKLLDDYIEDLRASQISEQGFQDFKSKRTE